MRRRRGGLVLPLGLGLVLTGSILAPAHAQLTVDFDPDTLIVGPSNPDRAFITVRNTSDAAASSIAYEWLTADSRSLDLDVALPAELQAGEEFSTTLTVHGRARLGGSRLLLRVSFDMGGRSHVVIARLRVSGHSAPRPSEVVDLEAVGSLAGLHDGDAGYLFLQVSNKSDYPVSVDSVVTLGPEFIHFDTARVVTVAPRGVQMIRIDLEADDWVRPGTHTLFFVTYLRWKDSGGFREANLVVSRDVEIGVLGESEILKVLSVPSFLLLPGFLMVIAFVMAGRRTRGEAVVTADPKKPEFWVLAVFLSLLWVYLYPMLPGGRSYLRGYGMADVAWVWAWSIGLGVLAAVVIHWIAWYRAKTAAAESAARTTAADDSEITTLRKLGRRRSGIRLPRVNFEVDGEPARALVLEEREDGGIWVAPAIRYEWNEGDAQPDQREKLADAMTAGDPETLATMLQALERAGVLTVYWHRQGSFAGPRRLERAMPPKGEGYLVEEVSE